MKKYILFTIASFCFTFSGKCWVKIEKNNGGFFGYKLVTEAVTGPNSALACYDPGRKSCRFSNGFSVVGSNGNIIKFDDYSPIETEVMKRLTKENTTGSFIYSSDIFVEYNYIIEKGKLTMQIYSMNEAKNLGLL